MVFVSVFGSRANLTNRIWMIFNSLFFSLNLAEQGWPTSLNTETKSAFILDVHILHSLGMIIPCIVMWKRHIDHVMRADCPAFFSVTWKILKCSTIGKSSSKIQSSLCHQLASWGSRQKRDLQTCVDGQRAMLLCLETVPTRCSQTWDKEAAWQSRMVTNWQWICQMQSPLPRMAILIYRQHFRSVATSHVVSRGSLLCSTCK